MDAIFTSKHYGKEPDQQNDTQMLFGAVVMLLNLSQIRVAPVAF